MKKLILFSLYFQIVFCGISFSQKADSVNMNKNTSLVIVKFNSGEIYKGYLLKQDTAFLYLKTEAAGEIKISVSKIQNISYLRDNHSKRNTSPDNNSQKSLSNEGGVFGNEMRYFLSTSAFNLKKNQKLIRNNPMTFEYGISDNWSMGLGTSFFTLSFGSTFSQINTKYTIRINELIGLKAGGNLIFTTSNNGNESVAYGLLNTGLTLGIPTLNFSFNYYYGNAFELFASNSFYSLSGQASLFKNLSIVTDNIVYSNNKANNYFSFNTLRLNVKKASIDLGIMLNSDVRNELEIIGIPILAFSILID